MAEEITRLTTYWDANILKLEEKIDKAVRKQETAARKITQSADTFTRQLEEKYGRIGKAFGNVFNDSRLATIQAGASHLGVFGSALEPLGVAGLAAAAGIAALAVASQQTIAAMKFADEIDDAAQKLNIGTTALQEYRFAMTEVGGEAKDADTALASFSETLGLAQSGLSPKALKVFTSLGFTKEQVDSWHTAQEALPHIADAIANLNNETEKSAAAAKTGLGPMLPLLREGSAGFEDAAKKAHALGLVMDADLVRKGAEANQQFESLSQVIDVQLKSAFVELSDEIVDFTGHVADALKALNDFLARFQQGSRLANAAYGDHFVDDLFKGDTAQAMGGAVRNILSGRAGNAFQHRNDSVYDGNMPSAAEMAALMATPRHGGGNDLIPVPKPGKTDHSAEQMARRQEQFEKALDRVQQELLRAYDTEFESIGSDAAQKIFQLNAEHAANLREITADENEYIQSKGLRGLSEAEAAQLRAAQEDLHNAKVREVTWQERQDLEAYRLKTAQEAAQSEIDLLDIQSQMTVTAGERRRIERAMLARTLQRERDADKAALALDPQLDDNQRAAALNQKDQVRQARLQLFDYRQLEDMRAEFRRNGQEVVDAIKAGKLGEYIADKLQQRLVDMALNGLFDMLTGSSKKGGTGLLGSIGGFLKGMIPGFASGTASAPGGLAYVHRGEVLTNLPKGAGVIPAGAVRAMGALQGAGWSAGQTNLNATIRINLEGANGDETIRRIAYQAAAEGSVQAVRQATQIGRLSLPGKQQQYRRLGTV